MRNELAILMTVVLPVIAGSWAEAIAEGIQRAWTWFDNRGPTVKRIGVAVIAIALVIVGLIAIRVLRQFGVPEPELQGWLAPIATGLAFLFHEARKRKAPTS